MQTRLHVDTYRRIKSAYTHLRHARSGRVMQYWFRSTPNFGDTLNIFLTNALSGSPPVWINPDHYPAENLFAVGSILSRANKYSIIWGSGYISEDSFCREPPGKVLAVRGPRTREKLLEQGISCPEVYGDPALLLPYIYRPNVKKKYSIGIIPHYVDIESPAINQFHNQDGVTIIDPRTTDTTSFIDDILECEKIASTSLHGLIIADAYSIPSAWITCSNLITGGSYKYLDYFASLGINQATPIYLEKEMKAKDLEGAFYHRPLCLDLDRLLQVFPYNSLSYREK